MCFHEHLIDFSGAAFVPVANERQSADGKALRYIEQAKAAHPELQPVAIEMIEESEQSDLADTFDYYYVPTFYVDGVKVHEGGIYAEEVEKILRSALE